jgi:hypothetical protein
MLYRKEVWKMRNIEEENPDDDLSISKVYDEIEREKEQRFVNLMIEIIVSITLKELYQEEDNFITRDVNKKKKGS